MNTPERQSSFQIESDRAVIVLGHSERKEVGQLWGEALDARGIFEDIDVITLNRAAAVIGRASLKEHLKIASVFTHSAGITRVDQALQVVAINPPEPVSFFELMKRAVSVGNDPVTKEPGGHKTGPVDLAMAGVELARSPTSTLVTPLMIARGYSTVEQLCAREQDFPAGRAIVHAELDGFGFADNANLEIARHSGVTTMLLPNEYHNGILFAPHGIMDLMTPAILPDR